MFEDFLSDNFFAIILIANILLAAIMALMTMVNLLTLRSINSFISEQLDLQAKIFKLIRYRRSQELLDFLNKRADQKLLRKTK